MGSNYWREWMDAVDLFVDGDVDEYMMTRTTIQDNRINNVVMRQQGITQVISRTDEGEGLTPGDGIRRLPPAGESVVTMSPGVSPDPEGGTGLITQGTVPIQGGGSSKHAPR